MRLPSYALAAAIGVLAVGAVIAWLMNELGARYAVRYLWPRTRGHVLTSGGLALATDAVIASVDPDHFGLALWRVEVLGVLLIAGLWWAL